MGGWDCYCFRRRQKVERKRLALAAGHEYDPDESEPEDGNGQNDDEEDDDEVDSEDEDFSYDPELAPPAKLEWLNDVRVLGINSEATGSTKAFITGKVDYLDYGQAEVSVGSDPNQPPGARSFPCYVDRDGDKAGFPFHVSCMVVLEKAFRWSSPSIKTRQTNIPKLELDVLYKTTSKLTASERYQFTEKLNICYGDISGPEQYWESIPGEEFSVADPLNFPVGALRDSSTQQGLPSRPRASVDPFEKLPNEIIHAICHNLRGRDLAAFVTASATAHFATLDQAFWKSICATHAPWLWELRGDSDMDKALGNVEINFKRFYICLYRYTSQAFGMTLSMVDWMGLTNRRRIWKTCLKLSKHYRQVARAAPAKEASSSL